MGKTDWKKPEDREKFWHSSSHLMAEAVQQLYPKAKFAIGPPIEEGFYYDFDIETPFTPDDLKKIEKEMKKAAAKKSKFVRKEMSMDEGKKLFKDQPYKVELIEDLEKDGEKKVSIYTSGSFTDLCRDRTLKQQSL